MFTGIITDIGRIEAAEQRGDLRLRIACGYDMASVDLGASIACSGVCLTVVDKGEDWFAVDVSAETIEPHRARPVGGGRPAQPRARAAGSATSSAAISSPAMSTASARSRRCAEVGGSMRLTIIAGAEIAPYIAPKGSIALDGVSLTVNEVETLSDGVRFALNIIPHTAAQTTLRRGRAGPDGQYRDRHPRPLYRPDDGAEALMERGFLSSPEELIDEARNGRMFILVDDEDRENEGDLVIPAQMATPDAINFMAKHGRGLICLALTKAAGRPARPRS